MQKTTIALAFMMLVNISSFVTSANDKSPDATSSNKGRTPDYSDQNSNKITARGTLELCQDLRRPNVSCDCVSQRMSKYLDQTTSVPLKKLLTTRYAYALGQTVNMDTALQEHYSNPNAVISAEVTYESLGGVPENIDDFEYGCAIHTDSLFAFPTIQEGSQAEKFVESRVRSVGESHRRESVCLADRLTQKLSTEELQAYLLSFSYYEGDHTNDDRASRARVMSVTPEEFQRLEQSARLKINRDRDSDANYCAAMTYAERLSVEQIQMAQAANETQLMSNKQPIQDHTPDQQADSNAHQRLLVSCLADLGDSAICACVADKLHADFGNDLGLMVDVREANDAISEGSNADGPLETVANKSGMTVEQLKQKLGGNIDQINAKVTMSRLACAKQFFN